MSADPWATKVTDRTDLCAATRHPTVCDLASTQKMKETVQRRALEK